ncbi:MAG: ribosome silencing factor [Candidatus Latescibacteria bacterium]|nr:ribosome silencing factor [Candidatus Latescibacterota bacterium]
MDTITNDIVRQAVDALLEKKASNIRIIDLRGLTSIVDYFVICSADSEPQLKAIVDQVTDDLKAQNNRPWHTEGTQSWRWVLIDYVDVVVHIFREETRVFYGLERLWGDAPVTAVVIDEKTGEASFVAEHAPAAEIVHE